MKRVIFSIGIFTALVFLFSSCTEGLVDEAVNDISLKKGNKGNDKATGFDQWGYNWNAHQFNGYLINAWFGDEIDASVPWYKKEPAFDGDILAYQEAYPEVLAYPFWIYGDMKIVMHWNESLISGEGVYQFPWIDTDAWITFHYSQGEGENRWSQFQKFVAVKSTDTMVSYFDDENGNPVFGEWFNEAGESVGWYYLWADMALIQVVNTGNVPADMLPGYKSPMGTGLGKYKNR